MSVWLKGAVSIQSPVFGPEQVVYVVSQKTGDIFSVEEGEDARELTVCLNIPAIRLLNLHFFRW